jgi:hypothetical protein
VGSVTNRMIHTHVARPAFPIDHRLVAVNLHGRNDTKSMLLALHVLFMPVPGFGLVHLVEDALAVAVEELHRVRGKVVSLEVSVAVHGAQEVLHVAKVHLNRAVVACQWAHVCVCVRARVCVCVCARVCA